MSRALWQLRRLRAMPPTEIAHRGRVALRDRLMPPRWARLAPADAFHRLYRGDAAFALKKSRLGAWLRLPGSPAGFGPVLEEAAHLHQGRWMLFGREVRIDDPPRWSRDPFTGAEWPDLPSARIDYREARGRGAKAASEISRLTVLPDLALAARLEGVRAYAATAVRWLDDWNARYPLGHGLPHTSGIEMAIRVITVSATLALLDPEGPRPALEPALGLIAQQALWCRDHLSLGSSANNHLVAEYAAMTAAGSLFPTLRRSRSLLADGHAGLGRELLAQIHPDGTPVEQAFGYLPFLWELALPALVAAETTGLRASPAVRARLAASLRFARTMRLPDGRMPQVGDEDDGRVLLAAEGWSRLDLAGNALAAWLDAEALSDSPRALATMLLARESRPPQTAEDGRHEFTPGGWTVWRERGLLVTFDHGPLGLGPIAAHGHADALSVTIFRGVDGVVVDPGTLAYHEDLAARDVCRSTPAHATVHFGGRSQSEMLGPFLWGRRATVSPSTGAPGWTCVWPSGETHARSVEVADGVVTLRDQARGGDPELVLPLAPGARVVLEGRRAIVVSGRSRAAISIEGGADWRAETSEHAPRFSLRVPAVRLVSPLTGPAVTRIELGDA